MSLVYSAAAERWPLAKPFTIARGVETDVTVVVVELRDGALCGRGESCPTPHYGETVDGTLAELETLFGQLRAGHSWDELHDEASPGAARNALDCAIWDLRAKQQGRPVWRLLQMEPPSPVRTVFTLGLDTPARMADAAREARGHAVLKLKLGAEGDLDRVAAVRIAVPEKRLIVDVNEAWTVDQLQAALPALAAWRIELVEQPLPAGKDDALATIEHLVPIGADESCHVTADLDRVAGLYDVVNIKLDKTGGLTEAMRLSRAAASRGLERMIGCMLGTSLAMAPSFLVAQSCRFVDLDAPLLIGRDRPDGLSYAGGFVSTPATTLWG